MMAFDVALQIWDVCFAIRLPDFDIWLANQLKLQPHHVLA
jgi:hypothetical protein